MLQRPVFGDNTTFVEFVGVINTNTAAKCTRYDITPDGTKIVYLLDDEFAGLPSLYVANIDGSGITRLFRGLNSFSTWVITSNIKVDSFKISPNSQKVAFIITYVQVSGGGGWESRMHGKTSSLLTASLDGTNLPSVNWEAPTGWAGETGVYEDFNAVNATLTNTGADPYVWADNYVGRLPTQYSYTFSSDSQYLLFTVGGYNDYSYVGTYDQQPPVWTSVRTNILAYTGVARFGVCKRAVHASNSPIKAGTIDLFIFNAELVRSIHNDSSSSGFIYETTLSDREKLVSVTSGGSVANISTDTAGDFIQSFTLTNDRTRILWSGSSTGTLLNLYTRLVDRSDSIVSLSAAATSNMGVSNSIYTFNFIPNEGKIWYIADNTINGVFDLYVVNVNGTGNTQLSTLSVNGRVIFAQASPDNVWIYYLTGVDEFSDSKLFRSKIDGSVIQERVSPISYTYPIKQFMISPDGSKISFWGSEGSDTRTRFLATTAGVTGDCIIATISTDVSSFPQPIEYNYPALNFSSNSVNLYFFPLHMKLFNTVSVFSKKISKNPNTSFAVFENNSSVVYYIFNFNKGFNYIPFFPVGENKILFVQYVSATKAHLFLAKV